MCPEGWHVPTDAEWTTLTSYLGGDLYAWGKMKSTATQPTTNGWDAPNIGATNESGFSAFPGGYSNYVGSFNFIRANAFFWSATEDGNSYAWFRFLYNLDGNVNRYNFYNYFYSISKSVGASVRCLRD